MKNSEQKQLDQVLKDNLLEGTTQVPDFVWDRIEEELFPKKKRRGFFWWFFGGLGLLLIGAFVGIGFSDSNAYSHKTVPPYTISKGTKTPVSAEEKLKKPDHFFASNSSKTQDGSQYCKFTTIKRKSSISNGSRKNLRSTQKTTYSASKNRIKSGSFTRMKNVITKKGILYSMPSSADHTSPATLTITQATQVKNEKQALASESEDKQLKTNDTESKNEILQEKDLSYSEILELIQRDFPKIPDDKSKQLPSSCVSIGVFGGPSLYHSAVFKDYFTSGQLSKRTFTSSGVELGLQAHFKVSPRFRIYAGLAFNQKQTQFTYDVAITQADYFTYIVNNEKVPLANIHDDGANSCFLAKDVTSRYQLRSTSISIGTQVEFLKIGKFSAAADLRLSCNLHSSLKLKEMRMLEIEQPQSENFSYLQPGAGLLFNFRLNHHISLGLAPFFSKQFYLKKSFSRKMDELVIPLSLCFDF